MFTQTEWLSLIDTLVEKTAKEEISWFLNKHGAYQYRLDPEIALTLKSIDGDDREPFSLVIWRPEESAERNLKAYAALKTGDLQGEWGPIDRLDELFKTVERQVHGASSVFKSMMDKLGTPKGGENASSSADDLPPS
ncbi:hypothetical protein [Arthrobacter sp. U41]|uniref:hypothetical protein n=1 Tax=Arthrobacter sp. U41 TaxID=1849032 RepID=UPI0011A91C00|nr:hypothetical protein [Arthrobacter sp. U41]